MKWGKNQFDLSQPLYIYEMINDEKVKDKILSYHSLLKNYIITPIGEIVGSNASNILNKNYKNWWKSNILYENDI